jgi:tRNA dimethylallyltransferase
MFDSAIRLREPHASDQRPPLGRRARGPDRSAGCTVSANMSRTTPTDSAHDPLRCHAYRCLIGSTGVGKSRAALLLAERTGAEIVSLDSMQVYRGMDIGTAKASAAEQARVRHHMLDLVEPSERFDVQQYLHALRPLVRDADERGQRLLFVGGTGFYLRALLSGLFEGPPVDVEIRRGIERRCEIEGNAALHRELAAIDPRCAARIHAHDRKRLVRALEVFRQTGRPLSDWQREWYGGDASDERTRDVRVVGLELPTAELDGRIALRVRSMLRARWPDEAAAVRARTGFGPTAIQALGYRDVLALADGEVDFESCASSIALATRQFARRQRTWHRKLAQTRWCRAPDEDRSERTLTPLVDELAGAFGWSAERAAQ